MINFDDVKYWMVVLAFVFVLAYAVLIIIFAIGTLFKWRWPKSIFDLGGYLAREVPRMSQEVQKNLAPDRRQPPQRPKFHLGDDNFALVKP